MLEKIMLKEVSGHVDIIPVRNTDLQEIMKGAGKYVGKWKDHLLISLKENYLKFKKKSWMVSFIIEINVKCVTTAV